MNTYDAPAPAAVARTAMLAAGNADDLMRRVELAGGLRGSSDWSERECRSFVELLTSPARAFVIDEFGPVLAPRLRAALDGTSATTARAKPAPAPRPTPLEEFVDLSRAYFDAPEDATCKSRFEAALIASAGRYDESERKELVDMLGPIEAAVLANQIDKLSGDQRIAAHTLQRQLLAKNPDVGGALRTWLGPWRVMPRRHGRPIGLRRWARQ